MRGLDRVLHYHFVPGCSLAELAQAQREPERLVCLDRRRWALSAMEEEPEEPGEPPIEEVLEQAEQVLQASI